MSAPPETAPRPRLERFELRGGRVVLEWIAEVEVGAGLTAVTLDGLEPEPQVVRARVEGAVVVGCRVLAPEAAPHPDRAALEGERVAVEGLLAWLERATPPAALDAFHPEAAWAAAEHLEALRADAVDRGEALRGSREGLSSSAARGRLELKLRAPAPGRARLMITTDGGPGRARPSARLELEPPSACATQLRLRARVEHATGLRAEGVRVALRRERPGRWVERPPRPWVIRSAPGYEERSAALQPEATPGAEDRPAAPADSSDPEPRPPEAPAPPLPGAPPERQRVAPGSFLIELGVLDCASRHAFLVRPALDARAHATLELWPPVPMPASELELRVEGELRGRLELGPAGPEAPWRIALGAEPRLIARRAVRTRMRAGGLLQREDVHETCARIEVESALDHPVELVIEDVVPVSVDPRVQVHFQAAAGQSLDARTGSVKQALRVEPEGWAQVEFRYAVEAPHDYRLVQALGHEP